MDAKTVEKFFHHLDKNQSQLVADLCNGKIEIDPFNIEDRFPGTQKWCSQCHNLPCQNSLVLSALNDVLGGHGIEGITSPDDHKIIGEYINQGDSYDPTIVHDTENNTFVLTTWADWYESWINEQNEENDTIQCGWCSHLTPLTDSENWSDTICEQCSNYVDGRKIGTP